jgi:DNA repair protein SbcD/Mre11
MFRFIHAADIHLDSPLRGLDQDETAPKERIRNATRVALKNLVDFALEEKVDFLVIAGDIYDGDWSDYATGHVFLEQMRRLAPIPVFVIHGNHDAINKMTKSLPKPDHLHVFGSKTAETMKLEELQVAIHGRSFGSSETRENLVRDYPAPAPGYFNIGLLHTSLVGIEGHDRYAPCSAEQLANHGYHYWALGHIHNGRHVRDADPTIIFPGNLQGRHAREIGPKGACLVTVDDNYRVTVEDRALEDVRWAVIEHKADPTNDAPAILTAVASQARTCLADGRLLVLRVCLSGECVAHDELVANRTSHAQQLRALLKDEHGDEVWLEDFRVETQPLRDEATDESIDDARSEVTRVLAEIREDPSWFASVAQGFAEVQDKLPADLFRGPDAIRLGTAEWLTYLLDRVPPVLFHTREELP